MNMLIDVKKPKASRVTLLETDTEDTFHQLLRDYWSFHYNDSLIDAVKLLLGTDLHWEEVTQHIIPPIGEVISPLGYALAHDDIEIRAAALEVLDATVSIPNGTAQIGEECASFEIDGFQIGVYPVTNAQYLRFLQETGHEPPKDWTEYPQLSYDIYGLKGDHPIIWVSCEDAEEYANYVVGRLPSFVEWQYTSRGHDDRLFPWGYEIDKPRCNTTELGAEGTTPVGMFKDGVSPFGCYDMLGNVWEWTDTSYDEKDAFRVACGGAWYYSHDYSTCISFDFFSKNYSEFIIGFRIAK